MDIPFENEALKEYLLTSSKIARHNLFTQIKGINHDVKTVLFQLGSRSVVNLQRLTLSKKNNTYHKYKRIKNCDTKHQQFAIAKNSLSITKNSAKYKRRDKVNYFPNSNHKKNSDSDVKKLNIVKPVSPSCNTRTRGALLNTETEHISPRTKRNVTPNSIKEGRIKTPRRLQSIFDKTTKPLLKSRNILNESENVEYKSKAVQTSKISTKSMSKCDINEPKARIESPRLKKLNSSSKSSDGVNESNNNSQHRQSVIIQSPFVTNKGSPKIDEKLERIRTSPRKLKVDKVRDEPAEKLRSPTKRNLTRTNSSQKIEDPCVDNLTRRESQAERIRLKLQQLFEPQDNNNSKGSNTREAKKTIHEKSDNTSNGDDSNPGSHCATEPIRETDDNEVNRIEAEVVTVMEALIESVKIFLEKPESEVSKSTTDIPVPESDISQKGAKLDNPTKTIAARMKKRRNSSFIASEHVCSKLNNAAFFLENDLTVIKNRDSFVNKSETLCSSTEQNLENIPKTSIRQDSVIVSANVSSTTSNPPIRQISVIESNSEIDKNKENSCLSVSSEIPPCAPQTVIYNLEDSSTKTKDSSKLRSPIYNSPKDNTNKSTQNTKNTQTNSKPEDSLKLPRETIIRETGLPAKTTKTVSTNTTTTDKIYKPKSNNNCDTPNVQDIILKSLTQMDKINENSINIGEETKQKSQCSYYKKPLHSILKNNSSAQEKYDESTQNSENSNSSYLKNINYRRKTINDTKPSPQRTGRWEGRISQANYISYGQILENRKEIFSVKKSIDFVTPLMVAHTGWSTPQVIDLPAQKSSHTRRRSFVKNKNDALDMNTHSVNEPKKAEASKPTLNPESVTLKNSTSQFKNNQFHSKNKPIPNRRHSTIETTPIGKHSNKANDSVSKQITKRRNSTILNQNTKPAEAVKSTEKLEPVKPKITTSRIPILKRRMSALATSKSEESSKKICLTPNANIGHLSDNQTNTESNPKISTTHSVSKNNNVDKKVQFSKSMPLLDDSPEANKKTKPLVTEDIRKRTDEKPKKRKQDTSDQTSRTKRMCTKDSTNLTVKINLSQINISEVFPTGEPTSTDTGSVKDVTTEKEDEQITDNGNSIHVVINSSLQTSGKNDLKINELVTEIDIPVHNKNSVDSLNVSLGLNENIEPKTTSDQNLNKSKLPEKSTNESRMSVDSAIDLDYLESNEDTHKESQVKNQPVVINPDNIAIGTIRRPAFNLLNSPYVGNLLQQQFQVASYEPVALTLLTVEKAAKHIVDVFMTLVNYCTKLKVIEDRINASPQQYSVIAPELKHVMDSLLASASIFYRQTRSVQIINFDMNQFCNVLYNTVKKRMAPTCALTIQKFRKEMINVIKKVTTSLTQTENKANLYSLLRDNIDKLNDSQENIDNLCNGDSNTVIDLTINSAKHNLEQSPKASTVEDVVISPPQLQKEDLININQNKSYLLPQGLQIINIPTVAQKPNISHYTLINENNNKEKQITSDKTPQMPQQPLNYRTSSDKPDKNPQVLDDVLNAHLQNLSTRNKAHLQNKPPALIPAVPKPPATQNIEKPNEPPTLNNASIRNKEPKNPLQNIVDQLHTLAGNIMNNAGPILQQYNPTQLVNSKPLLDKPTQNIPSYQINIPRCKPTGLNAKKVNNTSTSQNSNNPPINNYNQQYAPVSNNEQCPSVNNYHTAASNAQHLLNMRYPYAAYPNQQVYQSSNGKKPPVHNNAENIRANQEYERLKRSQEHKTNDDPLQTRQEMGKYLDEQLKTSAGDQEEYERYVHRTNLIMLENAYYNKNRAQLHSQYAVPNAQLINHQHYLHNQQQYLQKQQEQLYHQNQQDQMHLQQQYKQQQPQIEQQNLQQQQYLQQQQLQYLKHQQFLQQQHMQQQQQLQQKQQQQQQYQQQKRASNAKKSARPNLNYPPIGTNLHQVNHANNEHFNKINIQTASNSRDFNTTTANTVHPATINVSQETLNIPNSNSKPKNMTLPGTNIPITNLTTQIQENSIDQISNLSASNNITIHQNIYHSSHNTLIQVTSGQNKAILKTNQYDRQPGNQQRLVSNTQENLQLPNLTEIGHTNNNRKLIKILESVLLKEPKEYNQNKPILNNAKSTIPDNTVPDKQSFLVSVPEKNLSPCHNIDQILNKAILEHGLNNQVPDSTPVSKTLQEKFNHNIDQILNNSPTEDNVQPIDTSVSKSIGTITNSIQSSSNTITTCVNTFIQPVPINALQSVSNSKSTTNSNITNMTGGTTISNSIPRELTGIPSEFIDIDMLRSIVKASSKENPKTLTRIESTDSGYRSPSDHNTQLHNESDKCDGCTGPGNFLCSGCQAVYYCSQNCQSKTT